MLDILAQRKGSAVSGQVRPCSLSPTQQMWADLSIRWDFFDLCANVMGRTARVEAGSTSASGANAVPVKLIQQGSFRGWNPCNADLRLGMEQALRADSECAVASRRIHHPQAQPLLTWGKALVSVRPGPSVGRLPIGGGADRPPLAPARRDAQARPPQGRALASAGAAPCAGGLLGGRR